MARQARADDPEVGRIQRRKLNHRDADVASVMEELTTQRLGESFDRVLGGAVGSLQRNRAVGEGGSDLRFERPHVSDRRGFLVRNPLG